MEYSKWLAFVGQLRAANHNLDAKLREGLRPLGLSCVQADVLMELSDLQPCTLKTLSEHLIAESGHPSKLIARMKNKDLVRVDPSGEDGRSILISLTVRGEELAMQSLKVRHQIIDTLHLPVVSLEDLTGCLMCINKQLE